VPPKSAASDSLVVREDEVKENGFRLMISINTRDWHDHKRFDIVRAWNLSTYR
jgi:hypothetical protein